MYPVFKSLYNELPPVLALDLPTNLGGLALSETGREQEAEECKQELTGAVGIASAKTGTKP